MLQGKHTYTVCMYVYTYACTSIIDTYIYNWHDLPGQGLSGEMFYIFWNSETVWESDHHGTRSSAWNMHWKVMALKNSQNNWYTHSKDCLLGYMQWLHQKYSNNRLVPRIQKSSLQNPFNHHWSIISPCFVVKEKYNTCSDASAPHTEVSWNGGNPKSSIFGFSMKKSPSNARLGYHDYGSPHTTNQPTKLSSAKSRRWQGRLRPGKFWGR